jgi:serine O-acetyltransferase
MANEPTEVSGGSTAEDISLAALVAEDLRTHENNLLSPGFWALAAHRLGSRGTGVAPPVRSAARAAHAVLATAVDWTWGIRIPIDTQVGRRIRIWHFGSLLLNARSIGDDVHLRHDTTFDALAHADANDPLARPVIEADADIGSGACVLGAVTVGRGARVGANTVVLESVPAGATVFGVPSRVLSI